jgi:NAD(P)-dependent dehydrogenase (short-subunit alcohol dehydrogenase family)
MSSSAGLGVRRDGRLQRGQARRDRTAQERRTTLPLKRIGRLREVAQVAGWLLADAASFVNGITVSIDGGELAGAA